MAGSPDAGLDAGAAGEWLACAFPGAVEVAGQLPSGPVRPRGAYAERALALRMRAFVQQVPPYRALRGLQAFAADGWADGVALRYPSHAELAPPFRGRAADMRPAAHGWVDTAPGRGAPGPPGPSPGGPGDGPAEETLSGLLDRVRRYFAVNSAVGAIGSPEQERGLARVCLMLARFEAGVVPERGATAEEIHRSVPGEEAREAAGLAEGLRSALPLQAAAAVSLSGLLPFGRGQVRGVAEPVFVRGWAEGDLMIGGTLITVCLGGQVEVARRLRHLVAHAWLDDRDRYRVRRVALFTGIPNTLLSWPVADLAARLLPGADQGAARAEFRALARREASEPRPALAAAAAAAARPAAGLRRPAAPLPGYPGRAAPLGTRGWEPWDVVAGAEWTLWDLWFCVVCVADCDGDWDALDARLYAGRAGKQSGERYWCHLADLRERLSAAGLTAAGLAGDLAGHRKVIEKARAKVLKGTGVRAQDFSPAMRDVPSGRRILRAHFGSWDLYPVSPRPSYEQLAAAAPFDLEAPGGWLPTHGNIEPLFRALEELEAGNLKDPAALLAVRRAGLTACSLAFCCVDDSYGSLADSTSDALLRFSRTDWRATGIDPAVFWRDVLEMLTVIGEFGVATHKHAKELMAGPGAERDKALASHVADDLHAQYVSGRLDWAASRLKELWEFI